MISPIQSSVILLLQDRLLWHVELHNTADLRHLHAFVLQPGEDNSGKIIAGLLPLLKSSPLLILSKCSKFQVDTFNSFRVLNTNEKLNKDSNTTKTNTDAYADADTPT